VQQALLVIGWPYLHPVVFFAVSWLCTVPFALFSWTLVEKPAMDLKRRLDRREAAGRMLAQRLRARRSHPSAGNGAAAPDLPDAPNDEREAAPPTSAPSAR